MELLKILLDFVAKVAWPFTIIGILIYFKKYLIELLPYITKLKAGGIEVSIDQIKKIAEATVEELLEDKNIQTDISENLQKIVFQDDSQTLNNELHTENSNVMLAFASGASLKENRKFDIYYDPAYRNHNISFDYIGLYNQRCIVAIGKVSKIVYCNYDEETDQLIDTKPNSLSGLTEIESNRIKGIINETKYYDLKQGCKFFLVEKFYSTKYSKTSYGTIRSKKYFWLNMVKGYKPNIGIEELANLLSKDTW